METRVNLRDLRAFSAVVDQGSITAAASVLGETKGSISRRISRLETVLGISLLQRVGGRAQATTEGLNYYQRATEALEILDSAESELKDQQIAPQGHLRLTAAPGLADSMNLGACLGQFAQAYPKVSMEMILTEKQLSFREDQIDFAFRLVPDQLPDSGHKAILLAESPIGFAASPAYIEAHGMPAHPGELSQHRLLIPRNYGAGLSLTLQPCGEPENAQAFELQGHLLCQDTRLLQEAALAKGGIALMSPSVQAPYIERGELVPVLTGWESAQTGNFYLLYPGRPLAPKAVAFKEFVRQFFSTAESTKNVID